MAEKKVVELSKKLSSETRLKIIGILDDDKLSFQDVRDRYEDKYKDIRRETVYRELENLKESNLVKKEYDDENKVFLYSLKYDLVEINLSIMELKLKRTSKKSD